MKTIRSNYLFLSLFMLVSFNHSQAQDNDNSLYTVEEVNIKSGRFDIWGNLFIPSIGDKHPLIIFVAGDGNASREESFLLLESYGYFNLFIDNGFALLIDEKPGSGKSTGKFTRSNLFHERAKIVAAWIKKLKKHSSINPYQIGF